MPVKSPDRGLHMIALRLIEFLLVALIVIAIVWAVQQMVAGAGRKKSRLRSAQIAASFDYGREIMKQAFLFMEPFSAPGAFPSQQAPSGRSFIH